MTLEPTNEQAMALAQATGLGETRGMHVAMLLWPLVRDMVLGKAIEGVNDLECDWQDEGAMQDKVGALLRAMKGKP